LDSISLLSLCLTSGRVTPDALWSAWSFAPAVVIPLAALLFFYAQGAAALARRHTPLAPPAILAFAGGWLVLAVALISPLCRLSATLVSAHMVQHVLIVAVAPLLLVLGKTVDTVLAAIDAMRDRTERVRSPGAPGASTTNALAATLACGIAIWMWHAPAVYATVLVDPVVHTLAYGALTGVSVWFWHVTLRAGAAGLLCQVVTLIHTGALGALLTFAPRPWYGLMGAGAPSWGFTPLEDQQLAGLIMWIPMGGIYMLSALYLGASLIRGTVQSGNTQLESLAPVSRVA
jgi:putative membrane protein